MVWPVVNEAGLAISGPKHRMWKQVTYLLVVMTKMVIYEVIGLGKCSNGKKNGTQYNNIIITLLSF